MMRIKKHLDINFENPLIRKKIYGLSEYSKELKNVYRHLLDRRNHENEIQIFLSEKKIHYPIPKKDNPDDSQDSNSLDNILKCVKAGGIAGAVVAIIILSTYLLVVKTIPSVGPFPILLSGIAVGTLWGSILGLLIGPYFVCKMKILARDKISIRKATLSFLPHIQKNSAYFKKMFHFKLGDKSEYFKN